MIWKRKSAGRKNEFTSFKKLLVVCEAGDGDSELLKAVSELADKWAATLSVLSVVEPPSEIDRIARATGETVQEITSRIVAARKEEMAAVVDSLSGGSIAIDIRVGKPFIEIIRHAMANEIDLVVKNAEEIPGVGRYLFASTDQHLLRKNPGPVWLRRAAGPSSIKNILAAVDVDETTAGEPETLAGLNRRIMETAARVVAGDKAIVHLLHVWDAPGEGLVRMWSGTSDPDAAVKSYVDDVEANHRRSLEELADQARQWVGPEKAQHIQFRSRLERGVARHVIPQCADTLAADVLIMGTIARTGVPGFIIGNTAEDVLNSVRCSVITVKPPSYVSPVKLGGKT